MSATAPGSPTDKTGPSESTPPATKGLRKIPPKGRAAVVGRAAPPKTSAPRQQQTAAGTVRAAKGPLEQALSKPPQAKQRKIEPQKEGAPRRFVGSVATPFVVQQPPKSAPKTAATSPQAHAEKPVRVVSKEKVDAVASATLKKAAKKAPKFTAADAEKLAKNYTIVGSGSERRIVHVNDRTFGDKVRNLFQNRVSALREFAQTKNLTPEEMKQLPARIKAAITGLKSAKSAIETANWIGALVTNERAALIQALPADAKTVLFSASVATMKSDPDHPSLLLKAAINGTEPLSETIDKEFGMQTIERKKAMVQELIDGILLQCKNDPKDTEWKLRIQHLLGRYLLMSTDLQALSKEERNALSDAPEPAEFLMERLSACPPKTIENLCTVLGTTKKVLLFALIAETQKPIYTDWPDMLDLLQTIEAWAVAPKPTPSALDKLVGKIFPQGKKEIKM